MNAKPIVIGFIVVALISGGMWGLWEMYSEKLSQGMQAPESAKILNKIDEDGVPDFKLTQLNGEPLTLSQFKGKVVLLNFWASWCEPCIKEFPSMIKLIDELKGEVVLLAISADYEKKDMETFLKAFQVKSPHIYTAWDQDQKLAKSYGTFTLPESYIIGKDGKLVRKVTGIEEWATPDAIDFFKSLASMDASSSDASDSSEK